MSFLERFQGKIGSIGKQGEILSEGQQKKKILTGVHTPGARPTWEISSKISKTPVGESSNILQKYAFNQKTELALPKASPGAQDVGNQPLPKSISSSITQEKLLYQCVKQRKFRRKPGKLNVSVDEMLSNKAYRGIDRKNIRDIARRHLLPPKYPDQSPNSFVQEDKQNCARPWKAEQRHLHFQPYTMRDYRANISEKYICLGGLGANTGSEAWKAMKVKFDRMIEYARGANELNKRKYLISVEQNIPHKISKPELDKLLGRPTKSTIKSKFPFH